MKYLNVTSALALCLAASGAMAQDSANTQSASAGVALLAPQDTGFLFGATVGVNGVGSAAASVAESASVHGFTGYASSGKTAPTEGQAGSVSDAGVLGTFTFDRAVTVNGSLVGTGTAISEGMATGASGFSGSAFGTGEFGSTTSDGTSTTAATSSSNVESEAAMIGSVSTRANLQLNGAETRFAAANGTTLSESNEGFAYSALTSDSTSGGVTVNPLILAGQDNATIQAYEAFSGIDAGGDFDADLQQDGVSFAMDSELGGPIDLSIANAGGGSVALSAQSGGFFNGGSSAFGNFEFGTTTDGAN
jgi:hypothetical protein